MQRSFVLIAVAAVFAGAARGQNTPSTAPVVVQPTTPAAAPAPVVIATPTLAQPSAPAAPTSAVAPAKTEVAQTVYTPQLPSAAELTAAATAQGLTLERIVQTAHQVIAFYHNASGQTTTVAYQSLPPTSVAQPSPAPAVVVTQPQPTVVYRSAPRVIYYDAYPDFYPRYWYPPVSLSFGIGYSRGVHHGHHHHHHRR